MKTIPYLLCVAVLCACAAFTIAHAAAPIANKRNPLRTNKTVDTTALLVNAGVDTVVYKNQTRPDSIFLNGLASTAGQTYHWEFISGPTTPQIQLPDSITSWVTGVLTDGFYQFKLTVNGTASDTVVAFLRDWQKRGIYPCRAGYDTTTKSGGLKITLEPNFKGTYIKPDGSSGTWNQWNFITDVRGYVQSTKKITLSGGDTLLMEGADSTVWVELGGFGGDQGCPVYLMPHTKPVRIRGPNAFFRIATRDSNVAQYVVVDGTALRSAGYPYGFLFDNSGVNYAGNGSFTGGWVANFTLKGLHATKTNALKIKQDPTVRPFSRYDKWIQRNVLITDNWIDSSSVEGMYIGSSASDGGQTAYGWPIRMQNVSIINNLITNCKWDGIQLANAKTGNVIRHNLVYKAGTANQPSQRAGILLGGNTTGEVDSNLVINSKGDGIQVFGYDAVNVYNNIVDSIYGGSGDQDGMYESFIAFASEPNNIPLSVFNYNNLIGRIERNMIRVANNTNQMLPGRTHHNTFIHPTATDANSLIVTNVKGDVLENNTLIRSFPYILTSVGIKDNGINIAVTQADTTQTFTSVKATLSWLFGRLKSVSADNVPPVVEAGMDTTIGLPLDSVWLTGSATDADGGSIVRYQWTKLSGPDSLLISTPTVAQTLVKNLKEGSYRFQLAATDNGGLTAQDTIQVTVLPLPNRLPTANAESDQLITLPTNSATLSGAGSDADGTITTVRWAKISGASCTIQNASALQTTVGGLQQGVYDFELQVTDNRDGTATDTVRITVNAPPVVNAGNDQSITLPTSSVNLQGSATDSDGRIASVVWTKLSGPASYHFQDSMSATTIVDALTEGTYLFSLRATDNQSGSASDTVRITVLPVLNVGPTANAGPDQTITLPTNTVTLSGSGTDTDGSIKSYSWTKNSGPVQGTITTPNAATTTVTSLVAGSYIFRLAVTDNSGATTSDDVAITVNNAPTATTKTINVNIYGGSNAYANSAWNNWNVGTKSATNKTSTAFKYSDGSTSTITATLSNTAGVNDNGSTYGSGMAPAPVLRYTSYYNNTRTLTLKGLSTSKKYSVELYASRNASGSSDIFKINGVSQTIATYKNLTNKALFTNLSPNTSGQIVVSISKSGSNEYLNGFALTETTSTTTSIKAASALQAVEEPQEPVSGTTFELYPNPAENNLTLWLNTDHVGVMTIYISNTSGQVVRHIQVDKSQLLIQSTVPVSGLPSGIYFIRVQIGTWSTSRKFIKL